MVKILKTKKTKTITKLTNEVKPKVNKYDIIFDLDHLSKLMHSDNFIINVPNYLNKFFFKYGSDVFYDNSQTFKLLSRDEAKKLIPNNYFKTIIKKDNDKEKIKNIRLSEYFDSDLFLKTNESKLVIEYDKEYKYQKNEFVRGFEVKFNYLNMKKDLPMNYNKELLMTDTIKEGVNMFFNHIKSALCSDNETEYTVVKRFLASSVMGHKLKIALILQSLKEQVGKGTVINFMQELLGDRFHKSSHPEEVISYTKCFEGCTLINLDEVPIAGSFKTYNDSMKSLITEPTFHCRAMREQPYQQKNTFNIIITSNNNSVLLSQSNNVRYYIPTCSNKLQGDKDYFDKLHKFLKNDDIKIAIFKEFEKIYNIEVKPYNWNGSNEELTSSKRNKIIEALPPIVKYIKNNYLLEKKGINEPVKDFELNFKLLYPRDNSSTITIGHYMSELNIECKRVVNKYFNGRKYIISFENLKQSFINKEWLTQDDTIELEDNEEIKKDENPLDYYSETEHPVDPDYKELYNKQSIELEKLKKELEELKNEKEIIKLEKEFKIIKQPDILSVLEKDLIELELEEKEIKELKSTKSEEKEKKNKSKCKEGNIQNEQIELNDKFSDDEFLNTLNKII